ncbi:MAG: TetR/AcrR family transcriptional regulator [Gordonia sp. (in: high G+C Gram-positive bacteria)]
MTTSDNPVKGQKRTRMSPQARRRQLVDFGRELWRQQPLESVTIEEVAEVAGVSRALVFHYFDSKQDFQRALVRAEAEVLLERTAPDESCDDTLAILMSALTNYVDYVVENEAGFIGVLRGAANADPAIRAVADATRSEMMDRIIRYGVDLDFRDGPAVRMAVAGWMAFVEETVIRWMSDPVLTRDQVLVLLAGSLPALAGIAADLAAD